MPTAPNFNLSPEQVQALSEKLIKELEEKLAKAPKPEDPSWEMLYKAAKQRSDDMAAEFSRRLSTKEEQIKFLSDTMEKNEASRKQLSEKKEREFLLEIQQAQFSLEQKEAEISTLRTDLQIKED